MGFSRWAMQTLAGPAILCAAVWAAVGGNYTFGGRLPWGGSLPLGASVGVDCLIAGIYVAILVPALLLVVRQPAQLLTGNVIVYVLLALLDFIGLFAFVYLNIDQLVPGSFGASPLSRIDAVYVATTTLTTLGSGNIQPTSEATRAVVTLESGLALVLVVGALGLLIAHIANGNRDRAQGSGK